MRKGKLLLLPNLLEETLSHELYLPAALGQKVEMLQGLIAESEKCARRYLRRFLSHERMAAMPLKLLNEHTKELGELMAPLLRGETWGLISDAGLPCIADPGADLVALAQGAGVEVETFAGPSSILMALQLSGFSGQRFAFHGYLPREEAELQKKIGELEKQSAHATQIWIEAPYRSQKMLQALKHQLDVKTRLCVAASLTTPQQKVKSLPVAEWRETSFILEKEPAVFLIQKFS